MMKKILLFFLCFFLAGHTLLTAQEANRTDDKGRRQGLWMDFYPNGQKRYEGQFKNNKCVGEFKYYDEQGRLKATNTFDKSGEKALNKTYNESGTLIATGYYVNQKKEGEWKYFSSDNGVLILLENNKNGKVEGVSKTFYDTGSPKSECTFVNGIREGAAKVFYPSGALKEEGIFRQGEKAGIWKSYNEDGDEISSENFTPPVLQGFE